MYIIEVYKTLYYPIQISLEEFGEIKTFDLKPNGGDIPVTSENRTEYVHAYLNWVLNTAIYEQFKAFYLGFHSVCASNALIVSIESKYSSDKNQKSLNKNR